MPLLNQQSNSFPHGYSFFSVASLQHLFKGGVYLRAAFILHIIIINYKQPYNAAKLLYHRAGGSKILYCAGERVLCVCAVINTAVINCRSCTNARNLLGRASQGCHGQQRLSRLHSIRKVWCVHVRVCAGAHWTLLEASLLSCPIAASIKFLKRIPGSQKILVWQLPGLPDLFTCP